MIKNLHLEILNKNQGLIIKKLDFLAKYDFYLAGGTALALQLGHRTSLDFDFYTRKNFDSDRLFNEISKTFGNKVIKTGVAKDTLFCQIKDVENSFFRYKFKLVRPLIRINGVFLASLEDIAAMKLVAISHRPAKRDYIDVYYLLSKFNLSEMLSFAEKKFITFNSYYTLRALTYFEDIKDNEERRIEMTNKNFSWKKAKEKILEEVKKYQLSMIK